ncbi:hypothetical protein DSA99_16315 [Salmonella enterica subsp. enterica]|nr:hypothetical protein [Salmonella enterica subsp. enterica serovar Johannesburg]MIK22853.1 hypothetical protein [Salmonella enterica subsp. enterica serovar Johannesburg]
MARLLPFLNIDTVLMFFLSRAYGYVKHIRNIQSTGCVHMFSIGRCVAYVDARHMFGISLFLSFLSEIRKKVKSDLNEITWNLSDIPYPTSPTCYL